MTEPSCRNGAESLVGSLSAAGVEVCFANPGTSEMQFIDALARTPAMRCVLGLFEGVVSGAADGYARMAGKPAITLLHLAPGLANAGANLHNAKKARAPILNIVGNHALRHLRYDAPLTADVAATASVFSDWVRTAQNSQTMARDAIEGLAVARGHPGRIATLIVPADIGWEKGSGGVAPLSPQEARPLDEMTVRRAVAALGPGAVIICSGTVLEDPHSTGLLAGIAEKTGAVLLAPPSNRRIERGAGRASIPRIPFGVDEAIELLSPFRRAILIETQPPVSFFAYRNRPSLLLPENCEVIQLAEFDQDGRLAVHELADAISAEAPRGKTKHPPITTPTAGPLTDDNLSAAIAAALPEGAIIIDEGMTRARLVEAYTVNGPPHSWLSITGGSIGIGPPLAAGAAIACPDRPTVVLQADGSAMYTFQALWTHAREQLNITTIVFANRGYEMLRQELANVGTNPGPAAFGLMDLTSPELDFVALAKGMGVPAVRTECALDLFRILSAAVREPGPFLIEAML
ncbi:acetolactate synthase large subunit [Aquamicrobium sp. LC103]|uniref:acetolactate synthase large subunit n=1 Tax=Aquamicrobium sp. LC103 TaxID=1120658 RepID=UPI00063EBDF6|nr:acetolactate synthase large subunit [Aquamicrobium sp. LC103]TKT81035.1 acetolactate synthase large subunit [Aquamicrobium sp. LC103]